MHTTIKESLARLHPGERKSAEQYLNAGYALADLACRARARLRHGAAIPSRRIAHFGRS
jgi:hypothetical protein